MYYRCPICDAWASYDSVPTAVVLCGCKFYTTPMIPVDDAVDCGDFKLRVVPSWG